MNKKFTNFKMILNWALKSLAFSLLLVLLIGYLMGYNAMIVAGGSAEPYIQYHGLIVIKKCSFDEIRVGTEENNYEDGDFVTFTSTGTSFTTHRVIAKDEETQIITTNGYQLGVLQDSQEHPTYDQIVGRVVYTSYVLGVLIYSFKLHQI